MKLYFFIVFFVSVYVKAENTKPGWINKLPEDNLFTYGIGESQSQVDKSEALNQAWVNSLVKMGLEQFPEFSKISLKYKESLKNTESESDYNSGLEYIDWKGIQEAKDLESPYVVYDEIEKSYKVYRLIKWSKKNIADNKRNFDKKVKYSMPISPEKNDEKINAITNNFLKLKKLNEDIDKREAYYGLFLLKIRCGITIHQLKSLLGEPVWTSDTESKSYGYTIKARWSNYIVEYNSRSPIIEEVRTNNGEGKTYYPCKK
jgi:hypothetical protein